MANSTTSRSEAVIGEFPPLVVMTRTEMKARTSADRKRKSRFPNRFEAHKRLQSETIPGRIINVPPASIRMYLGASCPF